MWNLVAALLPEAGTVLLVRATWSWNCDWFLLGIKSVGWTRRASPWIQTAGLTSEATKPYEKHAESRWTRLSAACHPAPRSVRLDALWGAALWSQIRALRFWCFSLCPSGVSFGDRKAHTYPSWAGESWLGVGRFCLKRVMECCWCRRSPERGLTPRGTVNAACLFIYLFCVLAPFLEPWGALALWAMHV